MKILLTGATGFVGSHTAKELTQRGHEVYALVRNPDRAQFLEKMGVRFVVGSLEELDPKKTNLPLLDGVIHNAGLIKARATDEFYRVNTEGTKRLLEVLSAQSITRFVFVSSISARGPNRSESDLEGLGPVSHYGKSKLKAEELVLNCRGRFPVTIIRPPIVYGPGDTATLIFFKMFRLGLFPVPGKSRRFSFVYVTDLAKTLATAVENDKAGEGPYYPDDSRGGYSWDEVLEIAGSIYGKKIHKVSLPLPLMYSAAFVSELTGRLLSQAPMFTREKFQEMKHPLWVCSHQLCSSTFQLPQITDLKTGFTQTKSWYVKQGWL